MILSTVPDIIGYRFRAAKIRLSIRNVCEAEGQFFAKEHDTQFDRNTGHIPVPDNAVYRNAEATIEAVASAYFANWVNTSFTDYCPETLEACRIELIEHWTNLRTHRMSRMNSCPEVKSNIVRLTENKSIIESDDLWFTRTYMVSTLAPKSEGDGLISTYGFQLVVLGEDKLRITMVELGSGGNYDVNQVMYGNFISDGVVELWPSDVRTNGNKYIADRIAKNIEYQLWRHEDEHKVRFKMGDMSLARMSLFLRNSLENNPLFTIN